MLESRVFAGSFGTGLHISKERAVLLLRPCSVYCLCIS